MKANSTIKPKYEEGTYYVWVGGRRMMTAVKKAFWDGLKGIKTTVTTVTL